MNPTARMIEYKIVKKINSLEEKVGALKDEDFPFKQFSFKESDVSTKFRGSLLTHLLLKLGKHLSVQEMKDILMFK